MFESLFKLEENWVLFFDLFSRNGNGDSVRPMAEEIRRRYPNMKFFFCCSRKNRLKHIDMADEVLLEKTLRFKYVCSKAKYIVSPMNFPNHGNKRKGQVFVQTWHGSPLKKFYLSRDKNNKDYKRVARLYRNTDIWCLQSEVFRKYLAEGFNLDEKVFYPTGTPRDDQLFLPVTEEEKNNIRKELNIPLGKKILLYIPTWKRYDFKTKVPFNVNNLKKEFSDEYILLIRSHAGLHTWVDDNLKPVNIFDNEFTFDASKAKDAYILYKIADIVISDYSTVVYDFALTRKPEILYIHDVDEFEKMFGFYFDIRTFSPFPKPRTESELIEAIKNYNVPIEEHEKFIQDYLGYEKGDATKKTVDLMFNFSQNT